MTKLQHAMRDSESVAWWEEAEVSLELKDGPGSGERHPFDLEERTALFGSAVIRFAKKIPCGVSFPENNRLVDQLVASEPQLAEEARRLYREASELLLIFASIYRK